MNLTARRERKKRKLGDGLLEPWDLSLRLRFGQRPCGLELHPVIGLRAEGLSEEPRGPRRDPAAPVYDLEDRLLREPDVPGERGVRHAERAKKTLVENLARVRRLRLHDRCLPPDPIARRRGRGP